MEIRNTVERRIPNRFIQFETSLGGSIPYFLLNEDAELNYWLGKNSKLKFSIFWLYQASFYSFILERVVCKK